VHPADVQRRYSSALRTWCAGPCLRVLRRGFVAANGPGCEKTQCLRLSLGFSILGHRWHRMLPQPGSSCRATPAGEKQSPACAAGGTRRMRRESNGVRRESNRSPSRSRAEPEELDEDLTVC
jgi:hypothetical protein